MTAKYYTTLLAVTLLLSGCVTAPETRTDRIDVLLGVRLMPYDELQQLCGERENLRSCGTEIWVFLRGEPKEYSRLFEIQFLSWHDIAQKCGFNTAACWENNVLYTAQYDIGNSYRMSVIGDLLADNLDMDITYNNREYLGRQLMVNLNGNPQVFEWDVNR